MSSSGPPWTMRDMQSRSALAESYLGQAVDSLRSAADPAVLWGPVPGRYEGSFLAPFQRSGDAGNRRLRFLRSSVIFSALAIEAYANCFLAEQVDAAEAERLDRHPTIDKLIAGARAAGAHPPLARGREPVQTLKTLVDVRNALVHPRAGSHGAFLQYLDATDEMLFGPIVAVKFLRCVAETIALLEDKSAGRLSLAGVSALLTDEPSVLDELLALIGPKIDFVIREDAPRPPDPIDEAQRRRTARFAASSED